MAGRPTLSVPHDSRIPDPPTRRSSPDDYDLYFGLTREDADLLEWSRSCLAIMDAQRSSVIESSMPPDDKISILHGMSLVLELVLEKWLEGAASHGRD